VGKGMLTMGQPNIVSAEREAIMEGEAATIMIDRRELDLRKGSSGKELD
jgi:hypothetical protein